MYDLMGKHAVVFRHSARTRYLLLDFDGPICSIYAGLTDATPANGRRRISSSLTRR